VPTYRVYCAEREATSADVTSPYHGIGRGRIGRFGQRDNAGYEETEWEEEVEAADSGAALDAFFREHVRDNAELMWVDEAGESQHVEGLTYDPEKSYIWIEDGKMMEYQGMDETTPGMATCPLCGGEGEVEEAIAEAFLAEHAEADGEGEGEVTWG